MPTRSHLQHHLWLLLAIFAIALGVRTFRASQEVVINPDVVRFVAQAKGLAADPLTTMRVEVFHPLHAALGYSVSRLLPEKWFEHEDFRIVMGLRIVGTICGSLVAVIIFLLARSLGASTWPSAGAALLWMVGRRTSVYGSDALSDMLFLFLFGMAALLAIVGFRRIQQRVPRQYVIPFALAGIFSGLSYLTRPEGLAVPLITCLVLLLSLMRQGQTRFPWLKVFRKRAAPFPAVAVAGLAHLAALALVAGPYMVHIGNVTGKKSVFAEAEVERLVQAGGMAVLPVFDPHAWAKVGEEIFETFGFAPVILLGVAMLLKPGLWGRPRLRLFTLLWMSVWLVVMLWLLRKAGYLDGRHTLPLTFLLHGLFALALVAWRRPPLLLKRYWPQLWERLPAWQRSASWPRVYAAVACVLAMTPGLVMLTQRPRADKANVLAAASWVRNNTPPETIICDYENLVSFYSQRRRQQVFGSTEQEITPQLKRLPAGAPAILICNVPSGSEPLRGAYVLRQSFPAPDQRSVIQIYQVP